MSPWHWPCALHQRRHLRCAGTEMLLLLSGCCGVHCCRLGLPACPAVHRHCLFMAFAVGARHHCIHCAGVGVVSSSSSSRLHGYAVVIVIVIPAWVVGHPSDRGGGCVINGAVGPLQTKQNKRREKTYISKHSCTV